MTETLLKVGHSTNPQKLAGSISACLTNSEFTENVTIRTVGAGALNQAIKAIILANKQLAKTGKYVTAYPLFKDVQMEDETKDITAIELRIKVANI